MLMTRAVRDRFDGVERLEAAVAAELGPDVAWVIRGDQAVLQASAAWGLRLEVVPREAGEASVRLEGDLTVSQLEALLRSLAGTSADGSADLVAGRHAGSLV